MSTTYGGAGGGESTMPYENETSWPEYHGGKLPYYNERTNKRQH